MESIHYSAFIPAETCVGSLYIEAVVESVATVVLDQALGRRLFSVLMGRKSDVHACPS